MFFKQVAQMTILWLKPNNYQGPFLKGKHSIYNIKTSNANHIGIFIMRVKDCIDGFQFVNIGKI